MSSALLRHLSVWLFVLACYGPTWAFMLKKYPLSRQQQWTLRQILFPDKLEDWSSHHVEAWLVQLGFQRYVDGFASDAGGIGVDGDRLIYLGTPDQLDHIEWQLSLLGVVSEQDQALLANAIEMLVAEGELSCLAMKNQEASNGGLDYQI